MNLQYEWYKVFYAAAKHLSFTKAAAELFVTQSAVSQTIRLLEEALEVKLFYKDGRRVKLTREGEILLEHVEPAIRLMDKGAATLRDMNQLHSGSIRLGASDTISRFLLLPYIKSFHEKHPLIRITINNRPSPISSELVQKGEIDFAVVNYEATLETQRLTVYPLTETENVFVATDAVLNANGLNRDKVNLKKLSRCTLITLEPKSTTRRLLDRFLAEKKVPWLPEFEGGSVELILEMASIGIGVGFVPKMALSKWADQNLKVIPIPEKIPTTSVCIVKHSQMPLTPATASAIEALRQFYASSSDD
jgi:DNA-binding transcriptional LysR family regulator